MMNEFSIVNFIDYKVFLKAFIGQLPHKGRGELQKLAQELGIHSSQMSQILGGNRDFTPELGLKICDYYEFGPIQTDYFIALIHHQRTNDEGMKEFYFSKIRTIQKNFKDLSKRLDGKLELSEKEKGLFYSSHLYTAIRVATSIEKFQTPEAIAEYFNIELAKVEEIVDFLISTGLCKKEGKKIVVGTGSTHIDSRSPFVLLHHNNWRLKAIERHKYMALDSELAYSCPMSISTKDKLIIREKVIQFIEEIHGILRNSEPEELVCLNIDWLKVN